MSSRLKITEVLALTRIAACGINFEGHIGVLRCMVVEQTGIRGGTYLI